MKNLVKINTNETIEKLYFKIKEGLKILNSAGTVENTGGDGVRSSNTQLSMKPEAQPIAFGVGR